MRADSTGARKLPHPLSDCLAQGVSQRPPHGRPETLKCRHFTGISRDPPGLVVAAWQPFHDCRQRVTIS
jgi:hypothetical protein